MISYDNVPQTGGVKYSFYGLSSDTKPTGSVDGEVILNGSTFYEMDTKKVSMFDQENQIWYQQ